MTQRQTQFDFDIFFYCTFHDNLFISEMPLIQDEIYKKKRNDNIDLEKKRDVRISKSQKSIRELSEKIN